MLVIMGRSNTGKSEIAKAIQAQNFNRVVTYTTRNQRPGEVDGLDYFFISKSEFIRKVNEGFFAEYQSYDTEFGDWYYGSAKESYSGDGVIILSPSGVKKVLEKLHNITVVLIDADDEVIKARQAARGDDKKEAERRFVQDIIDFKGMEDYADFIIMNNGEFTPEQIAQVIVEGYYGLEK